MLRCGFFGYMTRAMWGLVLYSYLTGAMWGLLLRCGALSSYMTGVMWGLLLRHDCCDVGLCPLT